MARAPPPAEPAGPPHGRFARLGSTRVARALAAHEHRTAAGLLALPVLIYLWPALVGGEIVSPIAMLYTLTPWESVAPDDLFAYYNYLTADVPWAVYPWREYARELIHAGTFPSWNPHVLTGVPFYTNPQNGLFTPFNLPLWVFSLDYGLGLSAALKLWAGGFGTYLLVRELRLGFLPGLLAGIAFAFCSLNITWLLPETLPGVAVMLPWMLWLVERTFRRGGLGNAIGLALVTAVALGGGHPGTQVHVLFAAGLYALLRTATASGEEAAQRWRRLALAGGGLAGGGLLMAFMLIPEALSSRDTVGTLARRGGEATLPGTRMPGDMIRTVLLPDWWGRPSAHEVADQPQMITSATSAIPINFLERTFYAGVVTALLAGVGLCWRGAWRRMVPFAALGFLGLALPLHLLGLRWVVDHLPVLELVQNQRFHFVFELSLAVLAAFGLQALLDRPREERWRIAVPAVGLLAGLVAFASAGAQPGDVGRVVRHFLTGVDYELDGVVRLTSAVWLLLLAGGVTAAMLALWRWPHRRHAIAVVLLLLATFDMLRFADGFNPMAPASKVIPPATPAIRHLQREADEGRFVALGISLSTDWSMRYGLHDVRGYDPPYPTARYYRLWRLANPTQVDWMPMMIDGLSDEVVQVMSVLGARHVLADPGVEEPGGGGALGALRRVYTGEDATVFENPRAAPRALVASAVTVADGEDGARAAVVDAGFDARRTAVVERGDPGTGGLDGASSDGGTVRIADEQPARVTLRASLDRRALVVLNDQLTAGWSVQVDGRDAEVVRVNSVMRGVVVPAGEHEIVWSYRVPGLRAGLVVSVLALAVLIGLGWRLLRRRA